MNSNAIQQVPVGKMVRNVVAAILLGLLLPILMMAEIGFFIPVISLGCVFAVFFQCNAGWIPAGVFLAFGMGSTAYVLGPRLMWTLMAASVLPGLFVIRGAASRRPFFEQLRAAVVMCVLGVVAAVFIDYAGSGTGLVSRLANMLREEFSQMSDAMFEPLVDAVNSALSASGMGGFNLFTVATYRLSLSGILDLMEQTYARLLPGTLLSGALLTAVLSTLWGNWAMAKQGLASAESFVGMSNWFLPPQITLGAVALWLVGFIGMTSGGEHWQTVYTTISQLTMALFSVQAAAAIDRQMISRGRSLGRRRGTIIALAVCSQIFRLVGMVMMIHGLLSALMGRKGALRKFIDQFRDDHTDHMDP